VEFIQRLNALKTSLSARLRSRKAQLSAEGNKSDLHEIEMYVCKILIEISRQAKIFALGRETNRPR